MKLSTQEQKATLARYDDPFARQLAKHKATPIRASSIRVLQINVGKICNQACHHCHVDASPIRTETMDADTARKCIELMGQLEQVDIVDITGGAPEINKHFKELVLGAVEADKHVIDRCNLTILEEEGYGDLYEFLSSNRVEVVASLPHYSALRTNQQRGRGVFEVSITALKKLNALGYGSNKKLPLNLVYNPSGLFLSGSQEQLEYEFKKHLWEDHKIVFNKLYCINNLPISRFLEALLRRGKFDDYMNLLKDAFNIATIEGLMCRHQISVGYDGQLYDCDFNQMLDIPASPIGHIDDWETKAMQRRCINIANHCYGCTAGAGSSCTGALT